jgi:hypothetical protein
VRAVLVVVTDVGVEDAFELAAAEDEDPRPARWTNPRVPTGGGLRPAFRPSGGRAACSLSTTGRTTSTLEGGKRAFPLGLGTARLRGRAATAVCDQTRRRTSSLTSTPWPGVEAIRTPVDIGRVGPHSSSPHHSSDDLSLSEATWFSSGARSDVRTYSGPVSRCRDRFQCFTARAFGGRTATSSPSRDLAHGLRRA